MARFITPSHISDAIKKLQTLPSYSKPSFALVVEGESETVEDQMTDDEVEQIEEEPTKKQAADEIEISPVEALFRTTVHDFNDEMAKSKKTLIDAQG